MTVAHLQTIIFHFDLLGNQRVAQCGRCEFCFHHDEVARFEVRSIRLDQGRRAKKIYRLRINREGGRGQRVDFAFNFKGRHARLVGLLLN